MTKYANSGNLYDISSLYLVVSLEAKSRHKPPLWPHPTIFGNFFHYQNISVKVFTMLFAPPICHFLSEKIYTRMPSNCICNEILFQSLQCACNKFSTRHSLLSSSQKIKPNILSNPDSVTKKLPGKHPKLDMYIFVA